MLLICFPSLHPKSSGQVVHWTKQISLFTWWNYDGSKQEQISNSSLERRWILFQHKAATHPCWTDYCIWHINSCNKVKAIVLVSASKHLLSTESGIWLQPQTLGSFAPLSCTTTPWAMHMGQWVSVTCTNCAVPMRTHLRRGCASALHPWGKKNPNYTKTWGESQLTNVPLGVCDLLCVLVHPHGGGRGG